MIHRVVLLGLLTINAAQAQIGDGPIQVFVLCGQSNMQGHGSITSIDWMARDSATAALVADFRDGKGDFVKRDDVAITYQRNAKTLKAGPLTVGYGARDDRIGPELAFGHTMGNALGNPVLLIKTAWGGKSLDVDFRPPSAGPLPANVLARMVERARKKKPDTTEAAVRKTAGHFYRQMLAEVRAALDRLEKEGRPCELAGFVWFQGFNDMIDAAKVSRYESNLVHLIRDVRRDLKAPRLPFVIGELGVGGLASAERNQRMADIRKAQAAPAAMAEFKGNVACVQTSKYWDNVAQKFLDTHYKRRKWDSAENKKKWQVMGSNLPYHYLGSAKIYSRCGQGFAEAMMGLLDPGSRKSPASNKRNGKGAAGE